MFSKLVIADHEIDAGAVAEALVYYGNVAVVGNSGVLANLIKQFGYDNLNRCLESGLLQFIYTRSLLSTQHHDAQILFDVGAVALSPRGNVEPASDERTAIREDIEALLPRALGSGKENFKQYTALASLVTPFDQILQIVEGARNDALDPEYVRAVIVALLDQRGQQLPKGFQMKLKTFDNRILFHTNLDYANAGLSPSIIMSNVVSAREKLFHAASRNAEVWAPPNLTPVIETLVNTLAQKSLHNPDRIDSFQKIELRGRSFREAINSGERSIGDLLDLLESDNAQRFKKWLGGLPPNAELVTEYYRSVFGESALTKSLPYKVLKSLLFVGAHIALSGAAVGAGILGEAAAAATGEGLGQTTDYLERKLLGGWKPNQFVDSQAVPFVKKS